MDFSKIYQRYAGKWVALNRGENKIIGAAVSSRVAFRKAVESGEKRPILFKVPRPSISWVGSDEVSL